MLRSSVLLLVAAVLLACSGCAFLRLKKDSAYVAESFAVIEGDVVPHSDAVKPVLVALWSDNDPKRTILRYWLMQGRGSFRFVVDAPGRYKIMAFEDLNGDMTCGQGEWAGIQPAAGALEVAPAQKLSGIEIALRPGGHDLPAIAVDALATAGTSTVSQLKLSLGEVVGLDDPRFSPEHAAAGLWEPSRFLREVGGGIYFLQPYDPGRVPVLFVHGINGTPRDWRFVVEHMDRNRLQPWVAYYASGARLDFICEPMDGKENGPGRRGCAADRSGRRRRTDPAAAPPHPLEPPDLSTPRAALSSFVVAMEAGYAYGKQEGRSRRSVAARAEMSRQLLRFMDLRDLAPSLQLSVGREAAACLKETLDRIERPPWSEIPGAQELSDRPGGLSRWTVPHTEIMLVRLPDGPREGQYVFSAETVQRAGEFYRRVKHLPYNVGATEGLYDAYVGAPGWMIPSGLIRSLPEWMRAPHERRYAGGGMSAGLQSLGESWQYEASARGPFTRR